MNPHETKIFEDWCTSEKDVGHIVQPNSATARQRLLGWKASATIYYFYFWPMLETMVKALEKLSVLGNGDKPGNSDGNRIAQEALKHFEKAMKAQEFSPQKKYILTKEQAIILTGFTGIMMGPFSDFHEAVEKKLGRSIWTHEFGSEEIWVEIKKAYTEDFKNMQPIGTAI